MRRLRLTFVRKYGLGSGGDRQEAVYSTVQTGRQQPLISVGLPGCGLVVLDPIGDGSCAEALVRTNSSSSSSSSSGGYEAFRQQALKLLQPRELFKGHVWKHATGSVDWDRVSSCRVYGMGTANLSVITEVELEVELDSIPANLVDLVIANQSAMLQDSGYWQDIGVVVLDLVNNLLQMSEDELSLWLQLPEPCQRSSTLSFMGQLKHRLTTREIWDLVKRRYQYNTYVLRIVQVGVAGCRGLGFRLTSPPLHMPSLACLACLLEKLGCPIGR
jgi:hypothetical protein